MALLLASLLSAASAPLPAPRPGAERAAAVDSVTVLAAPAELAWPAAGPVRLLSVIALRSGDPRFGGLSAVAASADGAGVLLLSDRGTLFEATLRREAGRVTALDHVRAHPLRDTGGRPVRGLQADPEGLANLPTGGFLVSFEADNRIWRYPEPGAAARRSTAPEAIDGLPINTGVEALAADASGAVFAIPEAPPEGGAFPVWRRDPESGAWETGRWPLRAPFHVTGADIGPDGRLYVLERDFGWLSGWAMRLSRAELAGWPDLKPETLVTLHRNGIDNMEGLSLWRDSGGTLRALLVSDDNFHPLQSTLLLELALPE